MIYYNDDNLYKFIKEEKIFHFKNKKKLKIIKNEFK